MAESNATQVILTDDGIKIIKAQNAADNAASGVNNLNDPNLMSVIEKQYNISQFAGLTSQFSVLTQNAKDDGIDTTAVTAAYNNLKRFMADILADPNHASDVDRVIYKKYQDAYNEELAKLQNALQNNTNNKFTSAASATSQAASTASQAFNQAQSAVNYVNSEVAVQSESIGKAQSTASDAVSKAESTASDFGKVDQKADSAVTSALNAQSAASDAVEQASSAAADSKDAKQIAGAVSQNYKTLTDGSTMTIAELQNGLAAKLTKTDLDGYATETWTQNKINTTADGINGTMSSIKSTVDSQTTNINTLQADSKGFKAQFDTVNGTLGKQTTNIGTLQASSKELSSNFSSLSTDNKTNKNDISQLKQTAQGFSSTLETVQTQVQNSAVGTNLLTGTSRDLQTAPDSSAKNVGGLVHTFSQDELQFLAGKQVTLRAFIHNPTAHTVNLVLWTRDSTIPYGVGTDIPAGTDGYSTITAYNISSSVPSGDISIRAYTEDAAISGVQYKELKLEKGSLSTDWCPNPADNATVTAFSKLSQTVDGMKSDISKKIEQKDLNGFATETWAQNKINTTADGINGTISSVKHTVNGHTTSINDLKADSHNFKSQFTTVKGTLSTQSTDIGTLQASSKSLSSNFDSLSSDNKTNQHNIGQLQASAKEFNNTLTTVQTQVKDSAVGTNLLLKTGTSFSMTGNNTVNQCGNGYSLANGYNVSSLASALGTLFTISFDWSVSGDSPSGSFMAQYNNTPWTQTPSVTVSSSNTSGHVSCPLNVSTNSKNIANMIGLRLDNFVGTITISNVKLEKGSLATDWCPNPVETATQSQITQLSKDINLRVKKDDLISQINVQARNILISTSGQLTLAADTVLFDTDKPVIIPSANIEKLLVNKKLTAADISANTFTTNNGTFTVDRNGSITAKNMTLTGGTLTSPTINASKIKGSTINGTTFNGGDIISNANNTAKYYPMTITPDGGYKSTYFDNAIGLQSSVESGAISYKYRSMIGSNGQYLSYDSVINGQGFESHSGYTSVKDATFSNTETITGYVNVTPSTGIYLYGPTQKINFAGNSDNIGSDGITMDAYGNLYGQNNSAYWRIGDSNSNRVADFGLDKRSGHQIIFSRNTSIGNLFLGVGHTIGMLDKKPLYFKRGDSRGNMLDIKAGAVHYTSLVKSSLLSVKKDVKRVDTAYWSQLVNSIDLATYQYKSDDNTSHLRLSSIVDDVNGTKQWRLPDVFISRDENGKLSGVDDSVLLNATLATVQEQQKEIDQSNGHNMELEARLNKLEAKLNG
ncbi:hypothetical protein ACE5SX_12420 [Lactiplantibacillus plantarum]|uniref:hypothetical protein n=1 Tax=Lactiplantibacillus plantarum TaxID=1590 RepID=UPI003C1DAFEC